MFFFFFFLIELKTKMSKGTGGFSIVFFNSFNGKVGSATACFRSVKLLQNGMFGINEILVHVGILFNPCENLRTKILYCINQKRIYRSLFI